MGQAKESVKNGVKKEDDNEKEIDFDTFLSSAGEFGLYQWLLSLSTLPFYIFGVFTYFGQMFMTEVSPNHWCWIPELENLTETERRTLAIPLDASDQYGYSHCSAYVANWSEVLITGLKPNSSWPVAACTAGWEFNKTEIPYPTISSEMGWVCENSSNQATAQSLFFVGSIIGGLIIGWVADRFGRLAAATCANMIACVAGIASSYSTNFIIFSVCRLFVGMGYDNCMMMTYLLTLEYVAPKYRTMIANLPFALFYTSGMVILPWISLACGHWKLVGLATSVPLALALLTPFVMPESPRWLLSKGRIEDTINRVLAIGRINKKTISPSMVERFRVSSPKNTDTESKSVLQLLKIPKLRNMYISICALYMCVMIIFDVSIRTVDQLKFDFFLSFTLVSLTELPSLLIVAFALDYTGRKWLLIGVSLICAPFCLLTAFMPAGLATVMCAIVMRFTVNIACNSAIQWAAELLPTPVRGSGSAIIHICGYVATVISPFIAYLEVVAYYLPFAITAAVVVLAIVLAFTLPETAKQDLPCTFEDAENLIRKQPFWDFPCSNKQIENKSEYVNSSFEMN